MTPKGAGTFEHMGVAPWGTDVGDKEVKKEGGVAWQGVSLVRCENSLEYFRAVLHFWLVGLAGKTPKRIECHLPLSPPPSLSNAHTCVLSFNLNACVARGRL